jgi:tRNA(fMet)-specific endonuclease VapC
LTPPRYLLDTNILSELVRHPGGVVAKRIALAGEDRICTSIIVACELRFGAAKRRSDRLTAQLDTVLAALDVLPFDAPADRCYADLRMRLESAGTPVGPNDMLIAAHALAIDAVVVTANLREFSRIEGLVAENWL